MVNATTTGDDMNNTSKNALGVGVEVLFRVDDNIVEVGTIADEQEPRENGPQAVTVYRVNNGDGENVGWFTAPELRRYHRRSPEWLIEPSLINKEGKLESSVEVVAQMQREGVDQKLIDRWLQGIETSAR